MLQVLYHPPSNDQLCEQLKARGAIHSPSVVNAFKETDRAHFLSHAADTDLELPDGEAYNDLPLRQGVLHLSAPSIYGAALEALELEEGLSFLNVGSGTGYLSSLAANILGPRSAQFGVECRAELVEHAREKLDELGHTHVELVHCNCFALDPESSMRFERIYVGAGASQTTAAIIFRMVRHSELPRLLTTPPYGARPPPPLHVPYATFSETPDMSSYGSLVSHPTHSSPNSACHLLAPPVPLRCPPLLLSPPCPPPRRP